MGEGRIDQPGVDTWLARALIDEGVLNEAQVRDALAAKRANAEQVTLARTLCARRLLDEETVDRLIGQTMGPTPGSGSHTARVPDALGGYRLKRQLGSGGMGVVYAAVHTATGAERAIKLMPRGDARRAERFRREAEAMARVDHPNVVRVHDLGVDEHYLYLVMDLAAGGSLEDRLHGGPLPFEEARGLIRDLARGLAEVHAAGILHRDLKPGNVLFDERGTPKLTDFGLARLAWEGSLTESGATMGTPSFIAPEQVQDSSRIDERADVYGLGAILYAALTGQPPFSGGSLMNVLAAVVNDRPVAPGLLRTGLPASLEAACLRALEKDPGDRPASAEAFAATLTQEPETARVSWLPAWMLLVTAGVVAALSYDAPKPAAPGPTGAAQPTPTASAAPPVPLPEAWPRDWNASKWFGPKERALLASVKGSEAIRIPERTFPGFFRLARLGHPEANRAVGIGYVTGVAPRRSIGHGLQHLIQAVKFGDRQAAGYLGSLFFDRRLLSSAEFDVGMLGSLGLAAELGYSLDDHALVGALAHLALKSKNDGFKRAARQLLRALARQGISAPKREADSWALVEAFFEPKEHVKAERTFRRTFERIRKGWLEQDEDLAEYARNLATMDQVPAVRHGNMARSAGLRRRAALAYLRGEELHSDEGSARLAELAWRGLLDFEPDPRMIVRWLTRLAERGEYVAARVMFRALARPRHRFNVVRDTKLAGAWLALWREFDPSTENGIRLEEERKLEMPGSPRLAWRLIRQRPVRYTGGR